MPDSKQPMARDPAGRTRPAQPRRPSWLRRWLGRRQPSTYQRCLAVHIHYAGPRSALY